MKKSIAGDAAKLTLIKILTTALTMLTAMLLSRFRTLEEYGTYSQLQLVTTLVSTIFMIGLPNSINYFLARAECEEEKRKFTSVYYSLISLLGIGAGGALCVALPFIIKYFNNIRIGTFWYFLLLYPWTKIVLSGIENLLVVYQKMKKLMTFKVLYGLVTLGIVAIAWILDIDFHTYMIAFTFSEIIFSLWCYVISGKLAKGFQFLVDKLYIKTIFKFCIPLGLASIVGTLNIELDKLLIGYLYNTEELAIYTNASKEMPVAIVATSITAVLMPQLVKLLKKEEKKKAVSLWSDATVLSYIFIAFCAAVLFVFAPEVITILYSDKYLPGVSVFRVYSLVLLLRVTYFGMILNSMGRTKFIFVTSIISMGLNLVLNFVFYYLFGFIGPAMATFVSIAITAYLQLMYTSNVIKIPFFQLFNWKQLFSITILNIIFAVFMFFLKTIVQQKIIGNNIIVSIVMGIIWGLLYLLLMRKLITKLWKNLSCES